MPDREIAVSAVTKRLVRQRCGFGCVLCGRPVYHYDHMRGYSLQTADVPEEITLLCPLHHDDKTRNRLPISKVLEANESPVNIRNGVSTPYEVHYSGNQFTINIGPGTFTGYGDYLCALLWRDEEVIAFNLSDDGGLSLNVNLRDRSGNLALSIINNEMIYAADLWDVEYVGRTLAVRQGKGDIMFELLFEPPSTISLTRAKLANDDVSITIDPSLIHVVGPFIPALGYPRERRAGSFQARGPRYAMTLDCSRPLPGGVGFAM